MRPKSKPVICCATLFDKNLENIFVVPGTTLFIEFKSCKHHDQLLGEIRIYLLQKPNQDIFECYGILIILYSLDIR